MNNEPIQLQSPEGEPQNVFKCSECGRAYINDRRSATLCCSPCECGKTPRADYSNECEDCYRSRIRKRRKEILDKASEVTTFDGMLYCELTPGGQDGFYSSMEEVCDAIACALHDGEEIDQPVFVHTCEKHVKGLDLEYAIENMMDDTYEDCDRPSKSSIAELQKHVDAFNDKESIIYYFPNRSEKIRIPLVEIDKHHA